MSGLYDGERPLRIIFIGDVVGQSGCDAVSQLLPKMIDDWKVDIAIVNGENAADGFGITEAIYHQFIAAGADVVTLGNHSWSKKEALTFIGNAPRLIRPLNYLPGTPGCGSVLIETRNGKRVLVINALGRLFMEPVNDPFGLLDEVISAHPLRKIADAIVLDFHGEASSEKLAAGYFCDGRVSLVVGTHKHVPTADHRILPLGTAYITDAGMTGDYESIIGIKKEEMMHRLTTGIPSGRFEAAEGVATMCGIAVETDAATGLATHVSPLHASPLASQGDEPIEDEAKAVRHRVVCIIMKTLVPQNLFMSDGTDLALPRNPPSSAMCS